MRRRALLASGAATAALMLATAPAAMGVGAARTHADVSVGSGLVGYTGLANAPGIGINGIYMGVSLDVPQVVSSLSTGGVGAGLASIAWPGDIGGNAGTAVLVLAPTAPSWVKILNDPVKAEAHSTGTQHAINKTLPGTLMESNASNTAVDALSQTKLSVPLLGSLGAFTGSSSTTLVGPNTIRAVANSAVTDISLAGGLIKIAALKSVAVVVSNGKTSHGHAATTVAGVTIAGIPVTIDKQGIHLAKSVLPTSAVTSLLSKTLKVLHMTTTFTPTLITHAGAASSYDAGALVLNYHPGTGTTNYSIELGRASAQVSATPSYVPPSITPPTSPPTTGTKTGGGSTGGSITLPPGGVTSVGPGGGAPPSIASQIGDAASSILLAGGPTGLMIFGVIAAMLACAFAGPRIASKFLDAPAAAGCEETE
jgi:hypothetical protein